MLMNLKPSASPAKMRLFLFPYAGGCASLYREWLPLLPAEVEPFALQLPGRENRFSESFITDWDEVVNLAFQAVYERTDKPFVIFGHSLGAKIAYFVTQKLEALGCSPEHLFVSGGRSPDIPRDKTLYNLPEAEFIDEMRRNGGTSEELLANKDMMDIIVPRLRSDYQLIDTAPLLDNKRNKVRCPLSALGGTDDADISEEAILGWEHFTLGAFSSHFLEGEHFFLHPQKDKVLNIVKTALNC